MLRVFTLAILIATCYGQRMAENVLSVPENNNCPDGYRWIGQACREIWLSEDFVNGIRNAITVPPNCPTGTQWINGQCRHIMPLGQNDFDINNVVTVPPNCPPGQEWIGGQCRDVWPKNVITVPPNCPPGQAWIGGQCRDIWNKEENVVPFSNKKQEVFNKFNDKLDDLSLLIARAFAKAEMKLQSRVARVIQDVVNEANEDPSGGDGSRRVVNIPNQCPAGFRPDANGICREIWF